MKAVDENEISNRGGDKEARDACHARVYAVASAAPRQSRYLFRGDPNLQNICPKPRNDSLWCWRKLFNLQHHPTFD